MAVTIARMDRGEFGEPVEFDLKGLSTDQKPSEIEGMPIGANSLFLELDTGNFYYFDGSAWQSLGA